MAWQTSFDTHIWIFAVGRGNAAFIRTGLNHGFILDMNSIDFDVAKFTKDQLVPKLDAYKESKIAQAVLSHPHGDHIAQCGELKKGSPLRPTLLTCPHDKDSEAGMPNEKLNWNRICNRDSDAENVENYKALYAERKLPLQTIEYVQGRSVPNLEYGIFYIRPPVCENLHPADDNAYGHSTSILFYLRHGTNSILFPGDMTCDGMDYILSEKDGVEKRYTKFDARWAGLNKEAHRKTGGQPSLKNLLNDGLTIFVAPHHGLESCYSAPTFKAMKDHKPKLVVISERIKTHGNDGDTKKEYLDGGSGLVVDIEGKQELRKSLHTKNDHHILAVFQNSGGAKVYAHRDPNKLLEKL